MGQNDEWLRFRESVISKNPTLEFLHIDEFKKKYWSKWLPNFTFPTVLEKYDDQDGYNDLPTSNSGLEIKITTAELNAMETTEQLVVRINKLLTE